MVGRTSASLRSGLTHNLIASLALQEAQEHVSSRIYCSLRTCRGSGREVSRGLSILSIAFILQLLLARSGYSQPDDQPIFDHISVGEGLSNVTVTAILQDHEGFMWFGTLDGLCRFDGYEMLVFRNNPLDTSSISDNVIWALCEDRAQNLWVGTYNGGLNKFDRKTHGFVNYKNAPRDPRSLSHNTVRALFEDMSGRFWVGTYGGGVNILDRTCGEFHHSGTGNDTLGVLGRSSIRSICGDPLGRIWIGTRDSGLYVLGPSGEPIHHYIGEAKNSHGLPSNSVGPILFENSESIWIGTAKGLARLNEEQQTWAQYLNDPADATSLGDDNITGLLKNDERTIWVGTFNGGLNRLDKATGQCVRFSNGSFAQGTLSDKSVRSLYNDRSGNVWIGTSNGGVNKINTERKRFRQLRHNPMDPGSLSEGEVWAICVDRAGVLWIGTDTGGLNKVEPSTGKVMHYQCDVRNPNSLSSNAVSAILEDSYGDFWVGTRKAGLNRLDKKANRWIHFRNNPSDASSLSRDAISTIFEDRSRTLWVGTWEGGLNRFNRASSDFTRFFHDPSNVKSLSHNRVTQITDGPDSTLWITTEGGGLNRLSLTTNECLHFRNNPANPWTLSNDRAYCMYEDRAGMLWIGTANGLNAFDQRTQKCKHYMIADGLASDYVRAIVGDEHGNLWLATSRGVTKLNPGANSIKNYDVRNGLQGEEFSGASCRTADGTILLGGPNGVSIFKPDSILDNPHVPPIAITRFQIFEKPVRHSFSMLAEKFIHLSYKEDFFSFAFSALDYANPQKNVYEYMMEGFDKDWIYARTRRYASYTNLDPGNYVFRVRGSNNDGLWNYVGTAIEVVIDPPFWQTWWFRILVLAAFASILLSIHNYRVSRLLEIERMRVRIASDLHDDIGSNLSSIALITDMVRSRLPNETQEVNRLAEVSHAARHTADALKDIVWIINPENEKLDDIVLRMKDSASRLLTGIEYSFNCAHDALKATLDMEFRRNLLLIYKEALNNIAKYSRAAKVDITVGEKDGHLRLTLADNGIGFDESTVKRGNGLKNIRMRAAEIGGHVEIRSVPGQGTTVALDVKIP